MRPRRRCHPSRNQRGYNRRRQRSKPTTPLQDRNMKIASMKGDMKHLEERIARTAERCTCGVCKKQFIEIWQKYFDPQSPLVTCPDCGDIRQRYSTFPHKCPPTKEEKAENDRIYAIESERRRLSDASDEEIEQILTQRMEKGKLIE